ncbi:MAG TPA: methionine ABC transporter permease [Rhodopila sp.]|jgi:D-methionine transport system permease protein|nr:methionine ABC transporter permease [Rhodopila sp.]
MYPNWPELFRTALFETLEMTVVAGAIAFVAGLPLGLVLVCTAEDGIAPHPWINRTLGFVVNAFRAVPFIVLMVALIPLTRLIAGTSIGTEAAIVPLAIGATPYYARIAEVSLREVDHGLIEAVKAMGGSRWTLIRSVLVPEALPGLLSGFTVTLVTMIGASAMAGVIGGGGLGDLAIRYGYQRFNTEIMAGVIVVLVALVSLVQLGGDRLARCFDHR